MSQEVPKQTTPVSPAQMLEALGRAWMRLFNASPSRQSVAVLLAQWALETGNGAHMICNNPGNARWFPGNAADWCQFMTWENVNGQRVNQMGKFRAFPTLEDGCADYLGMMHTRFAKAWPAVLAGDPGSFAHLLKVQGYYTAPENVYTAGLKARFATFASLPAASWETPAAVTVAPVAMIETDPDEPPPSAA